VRLRAPILAALFISAAIPTAPRLLSLTRQSFEFIPLSYEQRRVKLMGELYQSTRELGPATAERPAGINHFGIHVDDAKAATANLRQRGVKIDDPRVGRTISFITSVTDPAGVRMELSEIGPESMLGKAIASWR
jgi:catechol 2,3-dioxygenase-like lactoylglutathione lyase family enzyme